MSAADVHVRLEWSKKEEQPCEALGPRGVARAVVGVMVFCEREPRSIELTFVA